MRAFDQLARRALALLGLVSITVRNRENMKKKTNKTSERTIVETIGLNPKNHFKTHDAFKLWNHEVLYLEDKKYVKNPPMEKIGLVVGLLSMNDEIEVIVKFPFENEMYQVIKSEFDKLFISVPN